MRVRGDVFVQSLPEWTLLGEYCGVWDRQAPSSEAEAMEDDDTPDSADPFGLGPSSMIRSQTWLAAAL